MSLAPDTVIALARNDVNGVNVIPNATLEIKDITNTTHAQIYSLQSGAGSEITQPTTVDDNGTINFWIEPGYYMVTVAGQSPYGKTIGGGGLDYFTDEVNEQLDEVLNDAVQRPIVPFSPGDPYPDNSLWVEQPPTGGQIYRPKPSALPIAAGVFDYEKWVRVSDESAVYATLDDAINSNRIKDGDALDIVERTSGGGGGATWDVVAASTVTVNGDDIVQSVANSSLAIVLRVADKQDGLILSNMYGIPNGADQSNLLDFQSKFTTRHNPVSVYPGLVAINNPTDGSVFDFANFGGQGMPGFNPIGFVYHHYTDSTMIQVDNVGSDNAVLRLKNANNPIRRSDQPSDFIGDGRFIECWRNESDGDGGVTASRWGFYISKDFELIWPQQTSGTETVRLVNNVAAFTPLWNYEFKTTNEQQYLFRYNNGGGTPLSVEWINAADTTIINASDDLSVRPLGKLIFNPQGGMVKSQSPICPGVYSRSSLPTLTGADVGASAYLVDGTDRYPVHWNGTTWRKTSDNTVA